MMSRKQAFAWALIGALGCGCAKTPAMPTAAIADPTSASPVAASSSDVTASPSQEGHADSIYTVDKYDPHRKPSDDLAKTVSLATRHGKRIILEIGGRW